MLLYRRSLVEDVTAPLVRSFARSFVPLEEGGGGGVQRALVF